MNGNNVRSEISEILIISVINRIASFSLFSPIIRLKRVDTAVEKYVVIKITIDELKPPNPIS